MRKKYILLFILCCMVNHSMLLAQPTDNAQYQEKFVQTNGVNLHYLDFGGTGLPIIFLQSFHGDAREWVDYDFVGFAPRFTKSNRVFAITRRGWGKSTDPGWGYDVATQAEDVIAFMDALKLEKAIMVGRIPANMDITWIAEHHPNRLAGIVYIGNPHLFIDLTDTLVQRHVEMQATGSCDLGNDAIKKTLPRSSWRPHFLYDRDKLIQIPALRIIRPGMLSQPAFELMSFDMMMNYAKTDNFMHCNAAAKAYYQALAKDTLNQQRVKEALMKADRTMLMNEAVERVFGSHMKTITQDVPLTVRTEEDYAKYWLEAGSDFFYTNMMALISSLTK